MADKIKLIIALAIAIAALVGYYTLGDSVPSEPVRVLGMLFGLGVATFVATLSEPGANALAYSRGAIVEVRKVVWPTRKETVNTTLLVMAMVIMVGIILWLFDSLLGWGIQLMTGQGG
ncbi:MAG: preprotein translocase subunit SecE [Chromatiales bacterium]|nr:preprotein translocase subunit SecE [Chromatiales bacterium]